MKHRNRFLLKSLIAAGIVGTLLIRVTAQERSSNIRAENALIAAISKEYYEGNTPAAIELYKQIAAQYSNVQDVAAVALVRLGHIYEKLNSADAKRIYEKIVHDYPSQREPVRTAESRLKAMTESASRAIPASQGSTELPHSIIERSERGLWEAMTSDGRYISDGGPNRLLLRDTKTGGSRLLIDTGGSGDRIEHVAFSADGNQVAYTQFVAASGRYELHLLPIDAPSGTPSRRLPDGDAAYNAPFGWSRDGTQVFALLSFKGGTNQIAAISTKSSTVRWIKPLEWRWPDKASLSPDGRYIAYDAPLTRGSRDRDIFVIPVEGGEAAAIAPGPSRDALAVWTPDGNAVVFASDRSSTLDLWIMQVTDGKPRGTPQLLRSIGPLYPLGFSRDGSFYYVAGSDPTDIYTEGINLRVGPDWRPADRITIERFRGHNMEPAYSPDGKNIAFFSQRSPGFLSPQIGANGFLSIVVQSLEPGKEKSETPTAFVEASGSAWFPDGQSLVFSGRGDGPLDVYSLHRIDLRTGRDLIERTIPVADHSPTAVSPDGQEIYFVARNAGNGRSALMAYECQQQHVRELLQASSSHSKIGASLSVSPDGHQVAFSLSEGEPSLWSLRIIRTDGSAQAPLQIGEPANRTPLTVLGWSPDGKSVLSQSGDDGIPTWAPTGGGKVSRIGNGRYAKIQTVDSRGGNTAATLHGKSNWAVWMTRDLLWPKGEREGVFIASLSPTGKIEAPMPLTAQPIFWDESPSWSPDGKYIAFKRRVLGDESPRSSHDTVIHNVDTGAETSYDFRNGSVSPKWFPDGQSLLVGGDNQSAMRLFLDGERRKLQWKDSAFTYDYALSIVSRDGNTLYIPVRDRERDTSPSSIAAVDLATGELRRLLSVPGSFCVFGLSRDGETISMITTDDVSSNRGSLSRLRTNGSEYRVISTAVRCDLKEPNTFKQMKWTRDGKSILFSQTERNGSSLRIMRILADGSGKPEFTGLTIGGTGNLNFDLSPDGSQVVFSSDIRSVSIQ